jgi:hypothetical protein
VTAISAIWSFLIGESLPRFRWNWAEEDRGNKRKRTTPALLKREGVMCIFNGERMFINIFMISFLLLKVVL